MARGGLICSFILIFSYSVLAWNAVGHAAVAEIAQKYMSNNASAAIKAWNGNVTMAYVSIEPDWYGHTPNGRWSSRLHYCTLDKGAKQFTIKNSSCADGFCVVNAINVIVKIMDAIKPIYWAHPDNSHCPSPATFLIHFIGDCHQPLHIGWRSDRGGNSFKVSWFSEDIDLHKVWDGGFFSRANYTAKKLANELINYINSNPVKFNQWKNSLDPSVWADESFQIVRNNVYTFSNDLDYFNSNINIVKERVAAAGVRLASVLNKIYG